MRKSVKLAAASVFAALAIAGSAATSASAGEHQKSSEQVNYCGNDSYESEAEAEKYSYAKSGDVEVQGQVNQTACVNGDENFVVNYNEGDVAGDDQVNVEEDHA